MVGTNPPPPLHIPYLASLNIPNLSKLKNDPILHEPIWPTMPTKLPSYIPKFEEKVGEYPANHIMTFHLWCSSNNIMDDSVWLRLFLCILIGPSAKWYVDDKSGSLMTFESLAKTFLTFFMTMVYNFSLSVNDPQPHTSSTTFTNGIADVVYAKKKPPKNNALIGFYDHSYLSLPKMWPPPSPKLKKKLSTRLNNMTSFIPSQDTYT
jgi:hypothetical protein